MEILIKGGTIMTSEGSIRSDVHVSGSKIADVGKNLKLSGDFNVIDATGMLVIPGAIDPHVHMCLPTPAGPSSDDFYTGSRAAITGGTTTIIDFVTPRRGQSLTEALDLRIKEAGNSLTDFSFHVSPVEWRDSTEKEIAECVKRGITSFKVYMAYRKTVGLRDEDFLKVLKTVGRLGGIVTVHCELGDEVDALRNDFVSKGHVEPEYHALSRPAELEVKAVKRAIEMAGDAGCPLYIVHVSAAGSLKYIEEARKKGQKVFAETCPHYLLLDDTVYKGSFENTAKYVISPPLRKKHDNTALWDAINSGVIDTIGTDHCPFTLKQKSAGIKDFRRIPNGAGSIEHRLSLMFAYGVSYKQVSYNKWVDLISTEPAKIFGLYPAKGVIAAGSDADIVVWNPSSVNTITTATHSHNCDLDMFDGYYSSGAAEVVMTGGNIVFEKGVFTKTKSKGRFLKRKP
jgi:dihydropyrimidinase